MSALRVSTLVKLGYLLAAVVWSVSLVLPAAELNGSMRLLGYRVFTIGVEALGAGLPGWLANPLLLAACGVGLWGRYVAATVLSGCACVLSLTSFHAQTMAQSRGLPIEQVEFEVGFFLWLGACSMIFATSVAAMRLQRRRRAGAT